MSLTKKRLAILAVLFAMLLLLGGYALASLLSDGPAPQSAAGTERLLPETKTAPARELPRAGGQNNGAAAQKAVSLENQGGAFSMVWMSDTQLYSESYPEIFFSMSDWTVENARAKNIQYVLHTGDVVNDRSKPGQWKNAEKATRAMMAQTPFFAVAGNHDTGTSKPSYAEYAKRYGPDVFRGLPTLGGFYKDGMGRYDLFEYGSHRFIIAGLGYVHTADSIAWLNDVLKEHADRTAILCFHSYLNINGNLTSHGQTFFKEVVRPNANVQLVLCGHKHGVYKKSAEIDDDGDGTADRTVQAILGDYQADKSGGAGFLRLLEFDPAQQKVSVTAYSPHTGEYRKGDRETFVFAMEF